MKIRSIIIASVFLASLMLPALSHSFENETNGFLGLTWGADISAFDGMVAVRTTAKDGTIYKKDNGEAGGVALTDTLYSFSPDGKLESVTAVIKDYKDFLALKTALLDKYGAVDDPLDETDMEKYIWSGEMTSIYLSYNRKTNTGVLFAGAAAEKSVEEVY